MTKDNAINPIAPTKVIIPSEEERSKLFDSYTRALGAVVFSWNCLHENLGSLFVIVSGTPKENIATGIWYSSESDKAQRNMLRSALQHSSDNRWPHAPDAKTSIKWVIDKTDSLAEQRNNAIHCPVTLYAGTPETTPAYGADFWQGHPRARKMWGKHLLDEFDLYSRIANTLTEHAFKIGRALKEGYGQGSWPKTPLLPTLGPKKTPKGP